MGKPIGESMDVPIEVIAGLPNGVRGVISLRGRIPGTNAGMGASRAPYDFFNLGGHVGDRPEAVSANRAALQEALGIEACWLSQVHGTDVLPLIRSNPHAAAHSAPHAAFRSDPHAAHSAQSAPAIHSTPQADASLTSEPGLACAILVADCMPILVARADGGLVGAAHAGWRGLAQGVLPRLLNAMLARNPHAAEQGFTLWLGPCIGPEAFEVGPEVKAAFCNAPYLQDTDLDPFFRPGRQDRLLADLAGLARLQTQHWAGQLGLAPPTIIADTRCTVSRTDLFFSYRKESVTGRMAALIWRDPDQTSQETI